MRDIKAIYRVQVGDQYAEFDNGMQMYMSVENLIAGLDKTFKKPVEPEDIRISVRSAPADPESPEWKTI